MINIPNTLTLSRLVMIPVFIYVYYLPYEWSNFAATVVFFFAAITDWFDGYLARKLGQQSQLGAILDPLADKLIVVIALILLVADNPANNWLLFSTIKISLRCIMSITIKDAYTLKWNGSRVKRFSR